MILPPNPSLRDLQLFWEKQYWWKSKMGWIWAAKAYDSFLLFFGPDRKPRDIFRSDVAEFRIWCEKKWSRTRASRYCEYGAHFYRLLDELELVEKDFNPFLGMAPRRIRD
jgi:hypothetical protein